MGWQVAGLTADAVTALVTAASPKLLHVEHRQASNTSALRTTGSSSSSAGWDQMQLTTVVTNEVTGASLASHAITLPAGDYEIDGYTTANQGRGCRARLYDQTAGDDLVLSGTGYAGDQAGTAQQNTRLPFKAKFTLSVESTIILEQNHQVLSNPAFGLASNRDSKVEVYAQLLIYKLP